MIEEYGKGNRVVLIVDEAQNLDAETIEELRVISNINADKNECVAVNKIPPTIAFTSPQQNTKNIKLVINENKEIFYGISFLSYIVG